MILSNKWLNWCQNARCQYMKKLQRGATERMPKMFLFYTKIAATSHSPPLHPIGTILASNEIWNG